MQPTPNELIAGIRTILRDTIGPAITDDYALAQLRQVLLVLGQVDWDDAALAVMRADAARRRLLADCGAWMGATPERTVAFDGPRAQLADVLGAATPALPSFADANAALAASGAALVAVIEALAAWARDHPDDGAAAQLAAIARHLTDPP